MGWTGLEMEMNMSGRQKRGEDGGRRSDHGHLKKEVSLLRPTFPLSSFSSRYHWSHITWQLLPRLGYT